MLTHDAAENGEREPLVTFQVPFFSTCSQSASQHAHGCMCFLLLSLLLLCVALSHSLPLSSCVWCLHVSDGWTLVRGVGCLLGQTNSRFLTQPHHHSLPQIPPTDSSLFTFVRFLPIGFCFDYHVLPTLDCFTRFFTQKIKLIYLQTQNTCSLLQADKEEASSRRHGTKTTL